MRTEHLEPEVLASVARPGSVGGLEHPIGLLRDPFRGGSAARAPKT